MNVPDMPSIVINLGHKLSTISTWLQFYTMSVIMYRIKKSQLQEASEIPNL